MEKVNRGERLAGAFMALIASGDVGAVRCFIGETDSGDLRSMLIWLYCRDGAIDEILSVYQDTLHTAPEEIREKGQRAALGEPGLIG